MGQRKVCGFGINEQRDWLKSLKIGKCSAEVGCLNFNYKISIREMRHRLNLARATQLTATGPSKETVMKRLADQLTKLKELARSAKNVEISDTRWGGKPEVCQDIWSNLKQAAVPEPTSYANNSQKKRDMYMNLRTMALHNQRLFFEMGNAVEDQKKYNSIFNDLWKKYSRDFSEYDDDRRDSANLLFLKTDTRAGFKRVVFVTILLDLDEYGLSLDRYELRPDGLFNDDVEGYSSGAHSDEYHDDNLMTEEQSKVKGPMDYMGLMTLRNDVMFWATNRNPLTQRKNWHVFIQPIRNNQDGRELSCSFEFNSAIKD